MLGSIKGNGIWKEELLNSQKHLNKHKAQNAKEQTKIVKTCKTDEPRGTTCEGDVHGSKRKAEKKHSETVCKQILCEYGIRDWGKW